MALRNSCCNAATDPCTAPDDYGPVFRDQEPALRYAAQTLAAAGDWVASKASKLARRPGSMILTIAPPHAGVAAEPAGAVTAAMIRAAKAENAMARSAVMGEISSKPDLVWLTSSRVLKLKGSIRGAKISSFSAA